MAEVFNSTAAGAISKFIEGLTMRSLLTVLLLIASALSAGE